MPKKYNGTVEEDNIETLPDAFFKNARPAREVLAELWGEKATTEFMATNAKTIAKRGRPPKPNKKREVKLRIDPDVLDAFKATGKGWQTHMNAVLRDHMPPAP